MKFSVIMPIYNGESVIEHSINSILRQTYKDFELILINDASTDKTQIICNKYAQNYKNIKIINKVSNEGVSKARNDGIQIAQGEYICFIDADDCVKEYWLEKYVSPKNPDLLCEGFLIYDNENIIERNYNKGQLFDETKKSVGILAILDNSALNPPWSKCYKASIIKKYNLLFWEGCNLFEDLIFSLSFLGKSKTIQLINYSGYEYHRENSTLTKRFIPSPLYLKWSKRVFHEVQSLVNNNLQSNIFKKVITSQFLLASFYPILHFDKLNKSDRYEFYKYILELKKNSFSRNIPLNRYIYKCNLIPILDKLVFVEYILYKKFRTPK